MKATRFVLMLLALSALFALAACGDKVEYEETEAAAPAGHATAEQAPASQPAADNLWHAEILETMNSGGYTYVKFVRDGAETWAAGPETAGFAVGDEVVMAPGMKMVNFHASSLDRDFAEIWFVTALEKDDHTHDASETGAMDPHGSSMPAGGGSNVVADADVETVMMAAGGYTVADIHAQAAALAGKAVKVRGRVVKFSANIMGTNWIHIQDGTGEGATADLTVTSGARVAAGDVVLVEGPLSVDKDFGAGYVYSVIVEGAEITKE